MRFSSCCKRASLLIVMTVVSLSGSSFGRDITAITSTDLKELVRTKKDKIVVLAFWGSWDKVCQRQIPELNPIYDKYKDKNVEIIGISLDKELKEAKNFVGEKDINFPTFIAQDKEEMSYIYKVNVIPTLIYCYAYGKEEDFKYHTEEGYIAPEHIEEDLNECLKGSIHESKDIGLTSK